MIHILWVIYLGIIGTAAIGYLLKGGYKTNLLRLDFIISVVTWIGLMGYVTGTSFWTPLVWKIIFFGGLFWDIFFSFKIRNEKGDFVYEEIPKNARPIVFGLSFLVFLGPLYYGLFRYAFL
ncbi:hypothetical protein GKZ89_16395 [Bacillus mangrovi]|uniref:DUF3995 domain-containing protein n=1 Tax=Metabacillus mangrovi TaxID=1491830 RepID=A0A7X2S7C1_9BACI|nr:hypothetical protein [Metabacillus mangrovi]MTH54984.1 hypothetical protein [Metabacillus mangrovi]